LDEAVCHPLEAKVQQSSIINPVSFDEKRLSVEVNPHGPEVLFEEMMPIGVNQGARPDMISPKPVSG
jgi:hypothetical protein